MNPYNWKLSLIRIIIIFIILAIGYATDNDGIAIIVILLFNLTSIWLMGFLRSQDQAMLLSAKSEYHAQLRHLAIDSSPEAINAARQAGQRYVELAQLVSSKTRPQEFTEAALTNDLARFKQASSAEQQPLSVQGQLAKLNELLVNNLAQQPQSIQERLAKLDELLASNLIQQNEYGQLRQKILDSI